MGNFFDRRSLILAAIAILVLCGVFYAAFRTDFLYRTYTVIGEAAQTLVHPSSSVEAANDAIGALTPIDPQAYDAKMIQLANVPPHTITVIVTSTIPGTSTIQRIKVTKTVSSTSPWPVKTAYPLAGALLPFHRIVAYYGNYYSTQMGVLGEYPPDQMLAMLASTTAEWQAADPTTPVIPAIDYIAVTAQGSAGKDKMYRLRMPDSQIQKSLDLAAQVHGLVFLDVQVGHSSVQTEVPLLEQFLKLPNVELCLDPEFALKDGAVPGEEIGTMDASEINFAAHFLAKLVDDNHLPPKILVVHRFTQHMITNADAITPLPEVQIVIDMDGWGPQAKKINTYTSFVAAEPVEFTGFKLFYKNDVKPPSTGMLTPVQVLSLSPRPSFIQYQ